MHRFLVLAAALATACTVFADRDSVSLRAADAGRDAPPGDAAFGDVAETGGAVSNDAGDAGMGGDTSEGVSDIGQGDVGAPCATEPDDAPDGATALDLSQTATHQGELCPGDVDHFRVELQPADQLRVQVSFAGGGPPRLALFHEQMGDMHVVPAWRDGVVELDERVGFGGGWYLALSLPEAAQPLTYELSVERRAISGTAYHIAPDGDDDAAGSAAEPWQTWQKAIAAVAPGDAIVALPGTWTTESCLGRPQPCFETEPVQIDCSGLVSIGSAFAPIRVIAARERESFIESSGLAPAIELQQCSWWELHGLRVGANDTPTVVGKPSVLSINESSDLVLRRILAASPNRWADTHALYLSDSSEILVEESEFYDFHRDGIWAASCFGCAMRRVYADSRDTPDVTGYASVTPNTGDAAFTPGADGLVENSIGHGVHNGFFVSRAGVKILGSATRGRGNGILTVGFSTSPIRDLVVENHVDFRSPWAIDITDCNNCVVSNATLMENATTAISANRSMLTYTTAGSFENVLALHGGVGVSVDGDPGYSATHANVYGQVDPYFPSSEPFDDASGRIQQSRMDAPTGVGRAVGDCLAYIPSTSNMAGAGLGGKDIGANLVFRYESGASTETKLWSPLDGGFPCGAIVTGVNDEAGSSCFDVHMRLLIGENGCAIP